VVGPVIEGMKNFGNYRIACLPDHPTPVKMMTHTAAPVPFVIYSGEESANEAVAGYDEDSAKATGLYIEEGFRLMEMLMAKDN
jgi:2,3-bisphosphoglycerate-independent phosphoglycerate mutase